MEIKTINLDKVDPISSRSQPTPVTPPANNLESSVVRSKLITVAIFIVVIGLGFYSGVLIKTNLGRRSSVATSGKNIQSEVPTNGVNVGDVYGSPDEKAFNTTATGVLDKGGLNGEGTHKLHRPGGVSQTVYMTSSVIDLDTLVGHQITVWGETFKGQKAGWLMDVGRVKVETLNAPIPK